MGRRQSPAQVTSGRQLFAGDSGRWATEQLLRAMREGRRISPAELRVMTTLREDEWKSFDEILIEEGMIRMRGVNDLIAAGLTRPIPNAMGKTLHQWEKISDMNDADLSLSGLQETEDDAVEFEQDNIPLPISHKDFSIDLRVLEASRTLGEPLDTTKVRVAGRKISELQENLLFNGSTKKFNNSAIYGYTTHPNRVELDFATAGEGWAGAGKTGEEILNDVLRMKAALVAQRFYGPYRVYIPGAYAQKLEEDFKAASDKSIRTRLMEVDGIIDIVVVDKLATDNVIMVQFTSDVVQLLTGEPLQTVQWDIAAGFKIKFKAFMIQVPLIRSDYSDRCGVCHMHEL